MKRDAVVLKSIAVLSLALVMTKFADAKTPKNPSAKTSAGSTMMQSDAARMVTVQANVVKPIDSRKAQASQNIQVVLSNKVQLTNGPELPRGTVLTGTASLSGAQAGGSARLALRFTEAQLKGGKTIPIKATIVGLFPAESLERNDREIWNSRSLKTDQSGFVPGLVLHSNVEESDSGVFESTKGNTVKLDSGNWMVLAIEALPDSPQEGNGSSGGA